MNDSTVRFGELLVRVGALTKEHVNDILEYQQNHPAMLFGQIAVELGYIDKKVVENYFGK